MAIDFRSTSLDSMGEADWISAALYCNRSTFNRMRRVAIKAGLLEGAGARDIRMGTVSEIAQYQRARDPERMADFNASIAEWQRITIGSLRANLQRLGIGKGELYDHSTYPTYFQLQAQLTREFRLFSIYAGGENLTNYRIPTPVIHAENPWSPAFDATQIWGPTEGAMFYVGVRFKLEKL